MAVAVSYPGVYIEEFAPGGPIAAAGTNIAAFLGPFAKGPIVSEKGPYKYPLKMTSWDQFKAIFGARPAPGFFTWFAVRGFFQNGGTACYAYRVSNAEYASEELVNANGGKLARVFALSPGLLATQITFDVQAPATPLLPAGTKLFAAIATGDVRGSELTITSSGPPSAGTGVAATAFRVGDQVQLSDAGNNPLGRMAHIKAIAGNKLILDERYPDTNGAQAKLMYEGVDDLRIVLGGPVAPGALAAGMVFRLSEPGKQPVEDVVELIRNEQLTKDFNTYRVSTRNGLQTKIDPSAAPVPFEAITFDVLISQGTGAPYRFVHLSSDPVSEQYYVTVINKYPNLVRIVAADPPPSVRSPAELVPAFRPFSVAGGSDELLPDLTDNDFTKALDQIRKLPDVRLVSIPDGYPGSVRGVTTSVHAAMIAHCEQMGDRFAVIDPPHSREMFGADSIETTRAGVDSARGYAALYYPWIQVSPAGKGPPVLVPPSGHVCGLMAHIDNTRGVHKAPANEILQGTIGVERTMTDSEQGLLNTQNINVIRVFKDGGRPYVFGARTTATDHNWDYVNVRRLFLFLEKSIQDAIRWAVFEPSNKSLWDKLKQSISAFLAAQWKAGAIFGDSPKDAYYVRIDETLNPDSERSLGKLHIEIGIRPTYPAEFIIIRIGIWQGGSAVAEG